MIKDYKKRLLICAIIILLGIALDQYIKWLCVKHLKPIGSVPFIRHVLQFTYVENRGAAFGMLQNQRWVFMAVSTLAIVGMCAFLFTLKNKEDTFLAIALSLVISGGIGNMIDRVALGYVVDMIDISPLFPFAVFNVADSFVCVGAALMTLAFILQWRKEAQAEKNAQIPASREEGDSHDS